MSENNEPLDKNLKLPVFVPGVGFYRKDYIELVQEKDLSKLLNAPIYSASETYHKNDYCLHEKALYKCKVESATGEFDEDDWNSVDITDFLRLGSPIRSSIKVGGIEANTTFSKGTSYDDMWDALLNPTLFPTLTDPETLLTYDVSENYEVGSEIPSKTATVVFNRGSISPSYGTSGNRSGAATNYALASSGADTEYSSSSESSGSFNVSALTRSTKGDIVLTATVSYSAGEQPLDSKGGNYSSPLPAGSKTASKTVHFIQAYFYGKSVSSTVSSLTGLTKSVTTKGQKQFNFTTDNEHMVIAYDKAYGNLTSILDQNGFETISGWTKSELVVDGFYYYVWVADSATTDTNAKFTFKY